MLKERIFLPPTVHVYTCQAEPCPSQGSVFGSLQRYTHRAGLSVGVQGLHVNRTDTDLS